MNKKFLSAILFGALMITSTGTFVSCKDYDDDINDLQTQIDNLATKSDVEAKLSQLQTAISAAQAEANEALAAAKKADNSAEIAALEAKIAAFKSCACDIDAMKAEIKEATDAQMKDFSDKINALIEQAKGLVGEVADYVTDVELVLTDPNAAYDVLKAMTVTQVKNTFGPNDELTFEQDKLTNFGGSLVVRISPTNAVPTAESISFINSQGATLDDIISVDTPTKFEGTLARAAATGLWKIPYSFKATTQKEFDAAIKATKTPQGNASMLYAVAVNNTLAAEGEPRNVVSGYDLTVAKESYTGSQELWFMAGGKLITEIKNRFGNNDQTEYKWVEGLKADKRTAVAADKSNVAEDVADNRNKNLELLSVKVGVPFDVVLTNKEGKALTNAEKPYHFYVTLDEAYAQQNSEPSEINAWKNYAKNTTGLNVLDTNGKVTITIDDETAEGDVIGYRVYAVNYDGTLVDPDGKSFYVYVGNATEVATSLVLNQVETPYNWTTVSSKAAAFSTSAWNRATTWELTSIADPTDNNKDVKETLGITLNSFKFYDKDEKEIAPANGTAVTNVTSVALKGVESAKLKDGVTYVATITAKNGTNVVATATISFTKELPGFPSTVVYPFTNILQGDVLYIYPIANETKKRAIYDMDNVWHGLSTEIVFTQTNATDKDIVKLNAAGKYPIFAYNNEDDSHRIGIDAIYVNPNTEVNSVYLTEVPANIACNYGNISYRKVDGVWKENQPWSPVGESFKVVFRNYADDCNFAWTGNAPKLAYNGVVGSTSFIAIDQLSVTDWYNAAVSLEKKNGAYANGYITDIKVNLLTGEKFDRVNEYYSGTIAAEDHHIAAAVDNLGDFEAQSLVQRNCTFVFDEYI